MELLFKLKILIVSSSQKIAIKSSIFEKAKLKILKFYLNFIFEKLQNHMFILAEMNCNFII